MDDDKKKTQDQQQKPRKKIVIKARDYSRALFVFILNGPPAG